MTVGDDRSFAKRSRLKAERTRMKVLIVAKDDLCVRHYMQNTLNVITVYGKSVKYHKFKRNTMKLA